MNSIPPDVAARDTISNEVDEVLFVEAGAGTGKTTSLVSRVLNVARKMRGGTLRDSAPSYIVAITFTEAAAQELSQRLREKFSEAKLGSDIVVATTIHSFAARILRSYGAFSDLPIGFQVLDGIAETEYLAEACSEAVKRLMDDELSSELLGHYYSLGATSSSLSEIYEELHDHWDRLLPAARKDDSSTCVGPACDDLKPMLDMSMLNKLLADLGELQDRGGGACSDPEDALYRYINEVLLPLRDELVCCPDDPDGVLEILSSALGGGTSERSLKKSTSKVGRKANWYSNTSKLGEQDGGKNPGSGDIDTVRGWCDDIRRTAESIIDQAGSYVANELLSVMSRLVVEDAHERVVQGRVTFHDLLVLTRNLLRDNTGIRERVREEYPYIFVDEFQDTDPLQADIIGYIVSTDNTCDFSNVRPGSLFVVGDPRQSIYRFRHADVNLYKSLLRSTTGNAVQDDSLLRNPSGKVSDDEDAISDASANSPTPVKKMGKKVVLSTNFRSVPQIIDLVNELFADVFDDDELRGDPLFAGRSDQDVSSEAILDNVHGVSPLPHVYSIGGPLAKGNTEGGNIAAVRQLSAKDMAECIGLMVEKGWPVHDNNGGTRPIRFRDIAILLPRRVSVESIEREFVRSGIPYHLEGTGSVWNSDEVFDIMSVLRAVVNPHDQLAVVSALRSPLIGCSDKEIYLWYQSGRRWSLLTAPEESEAVKGAYGEVGGDRSFLAHIEEGMGILRQLINISMGGSVSTLIRYILFDLGMLAAYTGNRSRESVALLRWFLSRVIEFDDTSVGNVADFISFVDNQALLEDRSAFRIPQDDDDNAVRIITVHGAKGLEFPAVFVAGINGDLNNTGHLSVLFDSSGVPFMKAGMAKSAGFDYLADSDHKADIDESKRLLYVTCTRARDYLIFMLHHKEESNKDTCYAALLHEWFGGHPEFKFDFPALGGRENVPKGTDRIGDIAHGGVAGNTTDSADKARFAGKLALCVDTPVVGEIVKELASLTREKQELSERIKDNLRRIMTPTAIQTSIEERLARDHSVPAAPMAPYRARGVARSREESQILGIAVHKVLEQLDLRAILPIMAASSRISDARQNNEIDAIVDRIAKSYHIGDMAYEVRRMVVGALGSATVKMAAACRYRQELPIATSLEGFLEGLDSSALAATSMSAMTKGAATRDEPTPLAVPSCADNSKSGSNGGVRGIVQGTIDLLIESGDELIIVDFKTETLNSRSDDPPGNVLPGQAPGESPGKDERSSHIYQLACYAGMVEAVTKTRVGRCVVVYLGGEDAVERIIEGIELRHAMAYIAKVLRGSLQKSLP